VSAVLVAGTWLGATYLSASAVRSMVEWEIGPAAMMACGRGFTMPPASLEPAAAFFLRHRPALDSADLRDVGTEPAPPIAHAERYGLWLAAQVFRVAGVSWRSVDLYVGALFGMSLALAWALFRLVTGPALATAGIVMLAWSNQLPALSSFRDYGKQPAFYALFLALGWLLVRAMKRDPRIDRAAAVTGLLVGIGLGFRVDVLVFVPAVLLVLALAPTPWTRAGLRRRAANAALFVGTALVAGAPVLVSMSQGSNSPHVVVLGLMQSFNRTLGLDAAPYDIGDAYDDLYGSLLIASHAEITGATAPPRYGSAAYDRAGSRLLADLAAWFPADVLVRTIGATAQVIRYPFDGYARGSHRTIEPFNQQRWFAKTGEWRDRLMAPLEGREMFVVALALGLVLSRNWALGLAAVALVWYFCGYAMLQFSRRHTFHLDLIPIGILLVAARLGVDAAGRFVRDPRATLDLVRATAWPRARAAGLALLVVIVLAWGSLLGLRWQQQRQLRVAIEQMLDGPWQEGLAVHEPRTSYLRIDLGQPCEPSAVDVRLVYDGAASLSRVFHVAVAEDGTSTVLAPAFHQGGADPVRFVGLDLPPAAARCIQRVRHTHDLRALPLPLMQFVLTPQWREQPLYQRLASPPAFTAAGTPTYLTHPPQAGGED
jgi:hypothetical protein